MTGLGMLAIGKVGAIKAALLAVALFGLAETGPVFTRLAITDKVVPATLLPLKNISWN